MHELPDKDKLRYLTDMISEEEILDMREATLEEGRAEGRAEGLSKAKEAVAMLRKGLTVQEVCANTGLSEEDVKALQ